MKCISLWQPWASLWLSEWKIHETRSWPTKHRGWIAVHAAKRVEKDPDDELRKIVEDEFGGHWAMDLPTGGIIGAVNLVACKPTEDMPAGHDLTEDYHCGNFEPNRFAWERREIIKLPAMIPYRGLQGVFNVPDELLSPYLKEAA